MKILILSWRGPGHPNAGGAELSTHEHAKGWVRMGHSVTLFTSIYPGAKNNELINGVEIIRRGKQLLGVHLEAFKWYIFENHQKFDIVVDQFHGIPFFTPFFVRTKKLAFIHEMAKEVWKLNEWKAPLSWFIAFVGSLAEPLIFLLYKNINFMTVSQSTKKDLIEWGIPIKRISVIHNGINIPRMKNLKKERVKTVTFLGALARDKGIEKAINIFGWLQKNYQQKLQFWVIGKGNKIYVDLLKKRATHLGLGNIKFWGYVDEDKKFNLLSRSHILINPSIREGWGLVVIEAAVVGTPTVACDVAGLRDSIIDGKTGILSKEYTIKVLSEKIISLLEDVKQYNIMCKNTVRWGRSFSWDKASQESLILLNKTVKE